MPAESAVAAPPPPASVSTPAAPAAAPARVPASESGAVTQNPPSRPRRAEFFKDIAKMAGVEETKPETKPASSETKPASDATNTPERGTKPESGETTPEKPGAAASSTAAPADAKDAGKETKPGKVNPWKLAEERKSEIVALRQQLEQAKSSSLGEQEKKELTSRLTQYESRIKEFEDEARFTNYRQSQEFKEKYQAPYDKAWTRAMGEVGELTIDLADGSSRNVTPNDLLDLVNMPLGRAHEHAKELYGDFAPHMMQHRAEIKRLADEQNAALEDAKKNGAEREKSMREATERQRGEIGDFIKTQFKGAYDEAMKDPQNGEFFSTKDDDDEWNEALERGRQLSASVFAEDPQNPKLSPAERAKIVKRHAAVFNRSAAFGPMKIALMKARKELAELKKENEGFKGSRPDATAARPGTTNGTAPAMKAKDKLFGALAAAARPY